MASAKKNKEPSFEQALVELEALIQEMENEQLPLETLVSHYEKGANLLKVCETALETSRKRIEAIELDTDYSSKGETSQDDIRLF